MPCAITFITTWTGTTFNSQRLFCAQISYKEFNKIALLWRNSHEQKITNLGSHNIYQSPPYINMVSKTKHAAKRQKAHVLSPSKQHIDTILIHLDASMEPVVLHQWCKCIVYSENSQTKGSFVHRLHTDQRTCSVDAVVLAALFICSFDKQCLDIHQHIRKLLLLDDNATIAIFRYNKSIETNVNVINSQQRRECDFYTWPESNHQKAL